MKKILNLILPFIIVIIGIQFTRDYFGSTSADKKSMLQKLISEGIETEAILKNEYTEKTVKIAKIPVKTYEVEYTFNAGDTEYTGLAVLKNPPSDPVVKVKYLSADPSVNAVDPERQLASLAENEGNTTTLFVGLGIILVGLGLGVFRYRSMIKTFG